MPQEFHLGVREGTQRRRRLRRRHRQRLVIVPLLLLQFLRFLPRHRHLVQQRQDVGPLRLRERNQIEANGGAFGASFAVYYPSLLNLYFLQ